MDRIRDDLSDAIRDDVGVPDIPAHDGRRDLSNILGNTSRAAGCFSDAVPSRVHLKFVSSYIRIMMNTKLMSDSQHRMHMMAR